MPVVAVDDFANANRVSIANPAENAFLITPHDTDELAHVTRAISLAVVGALKIVTVGGQTLVIPSGALAVGIMHPLRVKQVWSTGSGAGMGLVGYY